MKGWLCSCAMAAILLTIVSGTSGGHDIEKRAPMGFQGVRGKKSDTPYLENAVIDSSDNLFDALDKRAPMMGFQGMRGKKLFEQDLANLYQLKRAQMGFQGMRGKKDMEILNSGDYSPYDKRVPAASSFMGMRGKKEFEDFGFGEMENSPYADEAMFDELEKRAQMGFQGMRGKKSFDEMKRAPAVGFFGVRGKKHPSSASGFFGMRGKKYPYEFRGKFVGVRGKKLESESGAENTNDEQIDEDLKQWSMLNKNRQLINNGEDLNQMLVMLADKSDGQIAKRRDSTGFIGVRG